MITNCRRPCIANPVVRLYAIDIEKNKESTVRIGIDLGGTKTEVIALGDAGEQLYR
ncbi:fructokinase, partial [Escherichia coli]